METFREAIVTRDRDAVESMLANELAFRSPLAFRVPGSLEHPRHRRTSRESVWWAGCRQTRHQHVRTRMDVDGMEMCL
jgi:hypothetical protein